MTGKRKARLFQIDGAQAVRLLADFQFDGDAVYSTRDEATGDVILASQPRRNVWKEFISCHDSLDIPQEVLDEDMADRPMHQPVRWRSAFEDES